MHRLGEAGTEHDRRALAVARFGEPDMEHAGADRRLELRARPLGDHPPVVDHRDAVGELVGLLEILRGEEHGGAVPDQHPDDVPDLVAAPRVEAGGRLVEEQELRRDHEARGDVEPAPHAAGEGLDLAVGRLAEPEGGEQLVRPRLRLAAAIAEEPAEEDEILVAGQVLVDRGELPGEADPAAHRVGIGDHVEPEHAGAAAVGLEQRREHAHDRGLAGAVRAQEPVDRAAADDEVDAVDGAVRPEGLDQARRRDRRGGIVVHRRRSLAARRAAEFVSKDGVGYPADNSRQQRAGRRAFYRVRGLRRHPAPATCDRRHSRAGREPVDTRRLSPGGRGVREEPTMDRAVHEGRSTLEMMLAGERHLAPDPELIAIGNRARAHLRALNQLPREYAGERAAVLRELLGGFGRSWIESPFTVDYGVHTTIGDYSYVNVNCIFLDSARITIGDRVLIGPGVQLITATHPVEPAARTIDFPADPAFPFRAVSEAHPITIGDDVWIGAGAIILPGVTIGAGTTIGAGSVVTRSVPPGVVAAGNPARILRRLDGAGRDGRQRLALAG